MTNKQRKGGFMNNQNNAFSTSGGAQFGQSGIQNNFSERPSQGYNPNISEFPTNSNPTPHSENQGKNNNSRQDFGRQHAIYSGQASIKFYATTDKNGDFTINIEAAKKDGGNFDWKNKTTFQLMQKELGLLIAFLYGFTEIAVFDNHGAKSHPKSMTLKSQPDKGNFYISLSEKDKGMKGSQFDYADAMIIASMTISQMRKTLEFDSTDDLLKMVKHFIVTHHLPPLKSSWQQKMNRS